ncbi:SHOCT domain-containing protein [Salinibacter sp.]|uniref:SHOCT domain-containing protein n=1 Tax=Salinibacter sp. TaxID=2065818 RepID=UPI0021E6F30D|nr:SHOCT domain-containing protein [Salinibacter sp.]
MFILWVLLILGVGWALLTVLREGGSLPFSPDTREAPLEVLKRRYAGGEISAEEYEERKARLEG